MQVYQLKVSLLRLKPQIWRRVWVQPEISFHQLHILITILMNWSDAHLHRFECSTAEHQLDRKKKPIYIGNQTIQDDDFFIIKDYLEENDELLSNWLTKEKDKCIYVYDFGDNWRHEILLEKIITVESGRDIPVCLKAKNESPIEDNYDTWGQQVEVEIRKDDEIVRDINELFAKCREKLTPIDPQQKGLPFYKVPSLEEWDKLYKVTVAFRDLKCWQWMDDSQLFAIEDARTGQVAYCSVMGQAEDVFGIVAYMGQEGLNLLLKILCREITRQDFFDQRALSITFDNRDEVEKEDLDIIRALGLRFRGKNQWPVFRSYEPGLYPWFLNREEVLFLTKIVEQVIHIAMRAKENPELLHLANMQRMFSRRVYREGGQSFWEDSTTSLLDVKPDKTNPPEVVPPLNISEIEWFRLKKNSIKEPLSMEFDFQYFPEPMQENKGERPFYPYIGIWCDQRTGMIIDVELVMRGTQAYRFQEKLVQIVKMTKSIPKVIWVQSEEARNLLEPIASKLGTQISLVPKLHVIPEVMDTVIREFNREYN